jgi:aldehyde dehydrogenase (NAD+)
MVDASADLELAARTIAWGKFINAGQTCIAPDHVYVENSVQEKFVELVRRQIREFYGDGAEGKSRSFTRIVNARHTRRVAGLIQDAQARGARVIQGGVVDETESFVSATLIDSLPEDAQIMSEEIFGPVLPIISFSSVEEVIEKINAAPKPLAMYIWTRNDALAEKVIQGTSAGATCVNHIGMHFLHHNLPFGGVNNSGIGSYHGEWGIRAFSHERAVLKTRFLAARFFMPPYTNWTKRLVRAATRM